MTEASDSLLKPLLLKSQRPLTLRTAQDSDASTTRCFPAFILHYVHHPSFLLEFSNMIKSYLLLRLSSVLLVLVIPPTALCVCTTRPSPRSLSRSPYSNVLMVSLATFSFPDLFRSSTLFIHACVSPILFHLMLTIILGGNKYCFHFMDEEIEPNRVR